MMFKAERKNKNLSGKFNNPKLFYQHLMYQAILFKRCLTESAFIKS